MFNNKHPWIMLASVYITQYIGVAFILSAAMAILRQQGVALDKLALINLTMLPMVGKIVYAPIIDKFRFFLQGKYRSWLVFSNMGMVGLLLIVGTLDVSHQFSTILILMGVYTFFMSIQDVSVDGLSCKLFSQAERKYASSIQFSGNLLGNIIGGGVLLIFYPWLQWQGSLFTLAGLTALALIQVVLYREPEQGNDQPPLVRREFFPEVKQFISSNLAWFAVLVLYPLISTWGFALLNPILVDHHWSLPDLGFAMKVYGSVLGVVAAIMTAPLIARFGRNTMFMSMLCLQALALAVIIFPAYGWVDKSLVYLIITLHFISFPSLLVISATIFMDKAAMTSRKATFFTLQISCCSLFGFVYSWASMATVQHLGYHGSIIVGIMASMVIIPLVWRVLSQRKQSDSAHLSQQCVE